MKIILILIVLFFCCVEHNSTSRNNLPKLATEIVDRGNGWSEFTLDGRRYLFYHKSAPYVEMTAITEISD